MIAKQFSSFSLQELEELRAIAKCARITCTARLDDTARCQNHKVEIARRASALIDVIDARWSEIQMGEGGPVRIF